MTAEATIESMIGKEVVVSRLIDAPRERVFDAFARGATARGTRGTGLGLAVCRDIAEAHGGSISLDDGAASGTAVVVRIPTRSAR